MKKIISILLVWVTFISGFALDVTAKESFATDESRLLFDDVKSGRWYFNAVEFCYINKIIEGFSMYEFRPEDGLTRAQFVVMLAKLEGIDSYSGSFTQFTDVKPDHWYYNAVAWAYEEGIVSGMSEERFGANSIITRAQISRMMTQYMKKEHSIERDDGSLDLYSDRSSIPDWALEGMTNMVASGLMSGMTETTLVPNGILTRAQAAQIMMSFMLAYEYGNCKHSFADATCTESKTCTLCGLVESFPNGHILTDPNCTSDGECSVCGVTVTAAGHSYKEATCQTPETCRRCGETVGTPCAHNSTPVTCTQPGRCIWCNIIVTPQKEHKWGTVTCNEPVYCIICGVDRGFTYDHNWNPGNCTTPRYCMICGKTDGEAPGHNYYNLDNCSVCGATSPYTTVWYRLKRTDSYDYDTNTYTYSRVNEEGNAASSLIYDCTDGIIYTMYMKADSYGGMEITLIEFAKTGTLFNISYLYVDSNGNIITAAEGFVDAASFKNGVLPSFTSFEGDRNKIYEVRLKASAAIDEALKEGDKLMRLVSGAYGVKDLGFKNY